ncbi:hypothetical protein HDU87_006675 [Geranomyces variabilis]|uniref:Uncharacterized protein n=1 Tax=Geranomyces variabilis TaxID=109894 RepID=A0AAD5TFN0_9FUNG|nr:hypothetical protein HDU87_006675 [Geranomyces variabilis]
MSQHFQSEETCRTRLDVVLRQLRTHHPTLAPAIDAALRYAYENDPCWVGWWEKRKRAAQVDRGATTVLCHLSSKRKLDQLLAAEDDPADAASKDEDEPLGRPVPAAAAFEVEVDYLSGHTSIY